MCCKPKATRTIVVLPAPFAPTIPSTVPCGIENETSLIAVNLPYDFVTLSNWTTGAFASGFASSFEIGAPPVIFGAAGGGSASRTSTGVTGAAAGFAGACDGELSARQILGALAALLDWAGEERQRLTEEVHHLVLDGFLVPPHPG